MDLLVHLIKKNEINIYDIPIALVTEQYLQYLEWLDATERRVRGGVRGHGRHPDPDQVPHAAAGARRGGGRGGGPAPGRSCARCSNT
ncbi:MAG: hypothetical protein MZV70_75835 [Desulfobacterales bacterium]|nr:hypothetical protein [Desulfobacterales bacterium]